MEIIRDYRICKNPMGARLHDNQRYNLAPQPREEQIFKHNKVKKAGLPEEITASKVFDFDFYNRGEQPKEQKQISKPKKNKKFDVKKDAKGTNTKMKNIY